MGFVAICIPTYKNVEFVRRLLESIKKQTYDRFVVVISDDTRGSDIEKLVSGYSTFSIDYNRNEKKLGPTQNTNEAIKIAQKYSPDFIKIMHQDDYFSTEKSLLKLVQAMKENLDVDLIFAATNEKSQEYEYKRIVTEKQISELNADFRILYSSNIIGAPSATLIRNKGILMDPNLIWYVDIEWYMQILSKNKKTKYIKEPLITIYHSEHQVTQSCIYDPKLCLSEILYVYKKCLFLHLNKYKDYLIEKINMYWERINIIEDVKERDVYIYGAGVLGQQCASFLEVYSIDFKGFIVSDGQECQEEIMGHKVYTLSEFLEVQTDDIKIILALNKLNKKEVINNLNDCNLEYVCYS